MTTEPEPNQPPDTSRHVLTPEENRRGGKARTEAKVQAVRQNLRAVDVEAAAPIRARNAQTARAARREPKPCANLPGCDPVADQHGSRCPVGMRATTARWRAEKKSSAEGQK